MSGSTFIEWICVSRCELLTWAGSETDDREMTIVALQSWAAPISLSCRSFQRSLMVMGLTSPMGVSKCWRRGSLIRPDLAFAPQSLDQAFASSHRLLKANSLASLMCFAFANATAMPVLARAARSERSSALPATLPCGTFCSSRA